MGSAEWGTRRPSLVNFYSGNHLRQIRTSNVGYRRIKFGQVRNQVATENLELLQLWRRCDWSNNGGSGSNPPVQFRRITSGEKVLQKRATWAGISRLHLRHRHILGQNKIYLCPSIGQLHGIIKSKSGCVVAAMYKSRERVCHYIKELRYQFSRGNDSILNDNKAQPLIVTVRMGEVLQERQLDGLLQPGTTSSPQKALINYNPDIQ